MYEYTSASDTAKDFMLFKERIKYERIDDSTLFIFIVTDSIRPWHVNQFKSFYDTIGMHKEEIRKILYEKYYIDSLFTYTKYSRFLKIKLTNKTRIVIFSPHEKNDTLIFEYQKKFSEFNIYSFYYRFGGCDGDYRLFICDNIGPIAFYSIAWRNLKILDKIINADSLNDRVQYVKQLLHKDPGFFQAPVKYLPNEKVKFTPPTIKDE